MLTADKFYKLTPVEEGADALRRIRETGDTTGLYVVPMIANWIPNSDLRYVSGDDGACEAACYAGERQPLSDLVEYTFNSEMPSMLYGSLVLDGSPEVGSPAKIVACGRYCYPKVGVNGDVFITRNTRTAMLSLAMKP